MELYAHEFKFVIALAQRVKADRLKSSFNYFERPQAFVRECFRWEQLRSHEGKQLELCDYQGETLDALQRYRRHAICGPHGTRKTSTESMAALWFVITREVAQVPWKVLVTAGAWGQLRDYFWPEVHLWAGRLDWSKIPLPPFTSDQLLDFAIKLRHGRAISKASKSFQEGAHSENVLFIADEAKSIPARAFDAAEGALSIGNCFALAGSTPEDPEGRFYEIMTGADGFEHWNPRFIGKDEVIAAGAMNPDWADTMRRSYGEHSKIYLNRVEGKFSEAGSDSLFQLSSIRRANELYQIWKERGGQLTRLTSLGCDIASGGQDSTINALRQSGVKSVDVDGSEITIDVTEFEPQTNDTMQATGSLARQLQANPGASATLDVIGVGVGAGDRARELGLNVIPFYSNARTSARDAATGTIEFADKRSWLIWEFARRLKPDSGFNLAFPDYRQEGGMSLSAQLQTLTYAEESNGRIRVRSKRSTRNDLKGQSTNEADAIFYAHNPEADGIFKAHWWRYWMPAGLRPLDPVEIIGPTGEPQLVECVVIPEKFEAIVAAWHVAYKDDDTMKKPAFAVGQVLGFKGGDCFIVDQVRARQDFPSACAAMNALGKKWPGAFVKLVDLTQNGQTVITSMRRQVAGVKAIAPKDVLVSRANAVGASVYSGNVYLPHPQAANWVKGFIQEGAEFPNGANLEQVSALVLGIGSVRKLAGQKQTEFIL